MSLLSGRTKVDLYPEVTQLDGAGNPVRVPGPTATAVWGLLQPVTSSEADGSNQQVVTTYRLIVDRLPAGAWSKAVALGRTWDVVGEPLRRNDSTATSHTTVTLRARTAEPLT